MTDHESCIALNSISGIGYATYSALVRHFGSPSAISGHAKIDYLAVKRVGEKLASELENTDFELAMAKECDLAMRHDVRIIAITDPEYPSILLDLPNPPIVLYVAGTLPSFNRSLGVVGSREISSYAREQTRSISFDAAANGYVVVSGLAFGADKCAHTAALDANGITVAVIGSGLAKIYPPEHTDLAKEIINSGGAVISEFPMQFPVMSTGFPRRNRIITGLSKAVLVTEAGLKSGAMITAEYALKYNRPLFALPGRVDNPNALGCLKLLKEGAELVTDFSDIAKKFGDTVSVPQTADIQPETPEFHSPEEEKIWQKLSFDGTSFDSLAITLGMSAGDLTANLVSLEMRGLIENCSANTYRKKR